jgi:hypothetical protein
MPRNQQDLMLWSQSQLGIALSSNNMYSLLRIYNAYRRFITFISDPNQRKDLRHIQPLLAEPGLFTVKGIQLIIMEYDEEKKQFVIKAKAICFPMLVHEIVKGLYEIVGTKGFGPDKEKNQAIVNAVDKLSNEPRDLQYGKFMYDAISKLYNESDIEDARVRELFFSRIYKMPGTEFISFVENAINDELTPQQKQFAVSEMKKLETLLKKKDAEDAIKNMRNRG